MMQVTARTWHRAAAGTDGKRTPHGGEGRPHPEFGMLTEDPGEDGGGKCRRDASVFRMQYADRGVGVGGFFFFFFLLLLFFSLTPSPVRIFF